MENNKLKLAYENFKNAIDQSIENSISRQHAMDSNDVLLEKNLLAFLNDLINDFKEGYINIRKAIVGKDIMDEFKKNHKLSKEQCVKLLQDYLEQNNFYSKELKDSIREQLKNDTKKDVTTDILKDKIDSISKDLEEGNFDKDVSLKSEDILKSKDISNVKLDQKLENIDKNIIKKRI